jgi:hypothetical protein
MNMRRVTTIRPSFTGSLIYTLFALCELHKIERIWQDIHNIMLLAMAINFSPASFKIPAGTAQDNVRLYQYLYAHAYVRRPAMFAICLGTCLPVCRFTSHARDVRRMCGLPPHGHYPLWGMSIWGNRKRSIPRVGGTLLHWHKKPAVVTFLAASSV